jgi:hypothetical protein
MIWIPFRSPLFCVLGHQHQQTLSSCFDNALSILFLGAHSRAMYHCVFVNLVTEAVASRNVTKHAINIVALLLYYWPRLHDTSWHKIMLVTISKTSYYLGFHLERGRVSIQTRLGDETNTCPKI